MKTAAKERVRAWLRGFDATAPAGREAIESYADEIDARPRALRRFLRAEVDAGRAGYRRDGAEGFGRGAYYSLTPTTAESAASRFGRRVLRSYLPTARRQSMARKIRDAFVRDERAARERQRVDPAALTARRFDHAVGANPLPTATALAWHDRRALRERWTLLQNALESGHAEFWRVGDTALIAYDEQAGPRMALLRDTQRVIRNIIAMGILSRGIGSAENLAFLAASDMARDPDLVAAGHADNTDEPLARLVERRSDLRRRRGLEICKERVANAPELPEIEAARQLMTDCGLTLWPLRVDGRAWYIESLGPIRRAVPRASVPTEPATP